MRLGSLPKFIHPSRRDEPVSRNTPRRTLWLALVSASLGCDSVFTEPFAYGAVDVTVTLPDDRGVPGLDLTLYSGSRHHAYAVTDSTGAARFEFVPEGPLGVSIAPVTGSGATPACTSRVLKCWSGLAMGCGLLVGSGRKSARF